MQIERTNINDKKFNNKKKINDDISNVKFANCQGSASGRFIKESNLTR
jgi:hypothetical protein